MIASLKNMEWEFHIHNARHARHKTLVQGVRFLPDGKVFLLLCRSPRLIRDLISFDHAASRRHAMPGHVILEIVGSTTSNLPDSLEVRLAVRRARNCFGSRGGLSKSRRQMESRHEKNQK